MIFCKRCRVNVATHDAASLPMCESCAKTMEWRFKTPLRPLRPRTVVGMDASQPSPVQQASLSDLTPLGTVVPPIGAAEVLTPDGTVKDPITGVASVGNVTDTVKSGASGVASTAKSTAQAVSDTARTVRTLVIIGGVIGIGAIAYTMYNAQRTTARAMDILERHPDLLVKSGVLV